MTVRTMRDALVDRVVEWMRRDPMVFFVTADLGAPSLDHLRTEFESRFLNLGIAEQNLVNVSAGLALEGYTVFAFAIAAFLGTRAFEQIRNNLSLLCQIRPLNVNLVAVGAGLSYEVSGPSHHALEDLSALRALPHLHVCSPSDAAITSSFVDYAVSCRAPKYARLDGKPWPDIETKAEAADWKQGFRTLRTGRDVCLVATGCMTHTALRVAQEMASRGRALGVIDLYLLNPLNRSALLSALTSYSAVVTMEEAFAGRGGLDSLIRELVEQAPHRIRTTGIGMPPRYAFEVGTRAYMHAANGLDDRAVMRAVDGLLKPPVL